MHDIEIRFGEPIDVLLHRLYVLENMTMRQVAKAIGVRSDSTVWFWLLKFGIPTRRWMFPSGGKGDDADRGAVPTKTNM